MREQRLDDDWNDPALQYRIETREARFSSREETTEEFLNQDKQ